MVSAVKIDKDWVELTHLQRISREDLLREKETLDARLIKVNELLGVLNDGKT